MKINVILSLGGSFSKNHIERQESFGSRRNSVDDSVLWVHKNSCGEVFEGK